MNHIASFKKPIILSTGMNDILSVSKAVEILEKEKVRLHSCIPRIFLSYLT